MAERSRGGLYETQLNKIIAKRRRPDRTAAENSRRRWDNIGKPVDGLGELERMITKIAAMTGEVLPDLRKRAVVVLCGDHGVTAEGVTQTGQEVTAIVAENTASGRSSVCFMARTAGADVFTVDMGIAGEISQEILSERAESVLCSLSDGADPAEAVESVPSEFPPSGRLETGRIAVKKTSEDVRGTGNIALEPAMTREEAALSVCRGIECAAELKQKGYGILVTGEMGIGNTTPASAIACCISGMEIEEAVGRGAGLSDEGLQRKKDAVRRALLLHAPDPQDPLDILAKTGGYEIAAMTGLFIGGAVFGIPVVIDGVISAAAAVLADLLCPGCRDFMLASHLGKEPADSRLLDILELKPVIHAELALGEGTGGVLLLPLLDAAMNVYRSNVTFADISVETYQRMD